MAGADSGPPGAPLHTAAPRATQEEPRFCYRLLTPFSDAGKPIGERLLKLSHRLFHNWHRVRDGTLERKKFEDRMVRLRREVRRTLEEGSRCGCVKTSATCFEILKVEEGLWTFARVPGIEPTNNAAERA